MTSRPVYGERPLNYERRGRSVNNCRAQLSGKLRAVHSRNSRPINLFGFAKLTAFLFITRIFGKIAGVFLVSASTNWSFNSLKRCFADIIDVRRQRTCAVNVMDSSRTAVFLFGFRALETFARTFRSSAITIFNRSRSFRSKAVVTVFKSN